MVIINLKDTRNTIKREGEHKFRAMITSSYVDWIQIPRGKLHPWVPKVFASVITKPMSKVLEK